MNDFNGKFCEVGKEIYANISSNKNAKSLNLDDRFNLQIIFFESLNRAKKNLLVNDERIWKINGLDVFAELPIALDEL